MKHRLFLLLIHLFAYTWTPSIAQSNITLGGERTSLYLPLLQGKKVALIVNQTSTLSPKHTHLLDSLQSLGVDIRRVFAPEHGFRGNADAGEVVKDGKDLRTGIPITSLYGRNKKPTPEQLKDIDIMIFDIQDVGARFYTYISTLFYALEACSEQNKQLIVLDRPNPHDFVDGPMLDPKYKSFVGLLPIPLLHGVTVGELALMMIGEKWIPNHPKLLTVIPMTGWQHQQPYPLPIKPSPNLPNAQAIRLYPSLCLFEGTQVSIGRGTTMPFQVVGYPNSTFGAFSFTPQPLAGSDKNPLQKGRRCHGIDLRQNQSITGFDLSMLIHFQNNWPKDGTKMITNPKFFDLLAGTNQLREQLQAGWDEQRIRATWQADLNAYQIMRKKYLLYPEPLGE